MKQLYNSIHMLNKIKQWLTPLMFIKWLMVLIFFNLMEHPRGTRQSMNHPTFDIMKIHGILVEVSTSTRMLTYN
jgi:hypothetical protein